MEIKIDICDVSDEIIDNLKKRICSELLDFGIDKPNISISPCNIKLPEDKNKYKRFVRLFDLEKKYDLEGKL